MSKQRWYSICTGWCMMTFHMYTPILYITQEKLRVFQTRGGLTPYLKLGGCAASLLIRLAHWSSAFTELLCQWLPPGSAGLQPGSGSHAGAWRSQDMSHMRSVEALAYNRRKMWRARRCAMPVCHRRRCPTSPTSPRMLSALEQTPCVSVYWRQTPRRAPRQGAPCWPPGRPRWPPRRRLLCR